MVKLRIGILNSRNAFSEVILTKFPIAMQGSSVAGRGRRQRSGGTGEKVQRKRQRVHPGINAGALG